MNTKTILTATAAAILLVAAFLFGKSCNRCAEYSTAQIDSLVQINHQNALAHQYYKDSVEGQIRLNEAAISELQSQLTDTKTEAAKSKQNAQYWSTLYKQSKEINDTPTAIIACDELQSEFENYLVKTDRYMAKSDSLIQTQHGTIALQSELIDKQKAHIKGQDTAFQIVLAANNTMTADFAKLEKKLKRAKRWGNAKAIIAGMGGTFLGTQITK